MRTGILMMKTQVGIGVLSIPGAFAVLGLVPGVIALVAFGIITTWSDYQIGLFKLRHPEVYSLDGAGLLMFGKIGREVLMTGFQLCKVSRRLLRTATNRLTVNRLDLRHRVCLRVCSNSVECSL